MVEVGETPEAKLKRHEDALVACMAEIERLRAENECLRSAAGAHEVLRSIYGDSNQPAGVRVRAATAALNVETPRLTPVLPAIDLVAEPVEDLAARVTRERARMDRLLALPLEDRSALIAGVGRNGGNGSGDDDTFG